MTKFQVILAYNVPCYATIEVEASTHDEAIALALKDADNHNFEANYDCSEPGDTTGNNIYRVCDVVPAT